MERFFEQTIFYDANNADQEKMLVFVSPGRDNMIGSHSAPRVFECKTCKKQFPSFQALGGHRASHKKPTPPGEDGSSKLKMHECPICGVEFAVGQALGGHMRRHRPVGLAHGDGGSKQREIKKDLSFDLNEPASDEEEAE